MLTDPLLSNSAPSRKTSPSRTSAIKVVLCRRRAAEPDQELVKALEAILIKPEYGLFVDDHLQIGLEWARRIDDSIRSADGVVVLLSDAGLSSEMLEYELQIALDARLRTGRPGVLVVRIGSSELPPSNVTSLVAGLPWLNWNGAKDTPRLVAEIVEFLADIRPGRKTTHGTTSLRSGYGAESPFYIERESDGELLEGIRSLDSLLLIKAARQMGKTSLIGRGARFAKSQGFRIVSTDFQRLSSDLFDDAAACYRVLAASIARQLKFDYDFEHEWIPAHGPNANLDEFVRGLLEADERPLVWFMDEVDRLFAASFASEFFGLVRSWHNSRATDPDGPWDRFTMALAYATEAHLFIRDLNQSPFNVGVGIPLRGFDLRETQELNRRYGSPLKHPGEVYRLHRLIDGHPFLTRTALDFLVRTDGDLEALERDATLDFGPFGDHLKRVLVSVSQLGGVLAAMRASLSNMVLGESADVQRLVVAGIVVRGPLGNYAIRNELYRRYLAEHLKCPP